MTSSTPGMLSNTGRSSVPRLPVMPIAVRCAPGIGWALKPRVSIARTTPAMSSCVAPCRITTSIGSPRVPSRRPAKTRMLSCRLSDDRCAAAAARGAPVSALFRTKAVSDIVAEIESGGSGLKRTLGALDLVMLGIGAVIGAGIFSAIGTAAVGEVAADGTVVRYGAGPALVVSFVLLGIVCALAGLCYAELTALIPISGSAYTYAYATL